MNETSLRCTGFVVRVDGEIVTTAQFYAAQDAAVAEARVRSDYLNGVRPRRPQVTDHRWHPLTWTCLDCGIAQSAFCNSPAGCR